MSWENPAFFGNFDTWLCCSNNKQDKCHKFVCLFFLQYKFFVCEIIYKKGVISGLEKPSLQQAFFHLPSLNYFQRFQTLSPFVFSLLNGWELAWQTSGKSELLAQEWNLLVPDHQGAFFSRSGFYRSKTHHTPTEKVDSTSQRVTQKALVVSTLWTTGPRWITI